MRRILGIAVTFLLLGVVPAGASGSWFIPPVDGVIGRRFEPPGTTWGPGHRGIDYVVAAGTAVRAIGPGTVSFAGRVANTQAVTIVHANGFVSTYSDLSEVLVGAGDVS